MAQSPALEHAEELLVAAGQDHLAAHARSLPTDKQQQFLANLQASGILKDAKHYSNVFRRSMADFEAAAQGKHAAALVPPSAEDFFYATEESVLSSADHARAVEAYKEAGLKEIRDGRCAVLVLAGGSGTRLGASIPKGMLVCETLQQQKSLFQLHCEKVLKIQQLAGGTIQVAFMTSAQNDADTRAFFKENRCFGLDDAQVHFFVQSSVPCFDEQGQMILDTETSVAVAPGGNGGIYGSLASSGVLKRFKDGGVKHVQIFTVDNILAKMGDPFFYGYAATEAADVVVKATPKAHDHEAVGVFAKKDGKWGVVEYSEVGKELAEARSAETGTRMYDCANIAIHLCSVDFLARAASIMDTFEMYHVAKKPIPSREGKVPGVKIEAFIFDLFEFSEKFRIVQVDRWAEFAPIKNADDEAHTKRDTPYTSVNALQQLHCRWMLAAAGRSAADAKPGVVEIASSKSYDGENLAYAAPAFLEKLNSNDGKAMMLN